MTHSSFLNTVMKNKFTITLCTYSLSKQTIQDGVEFQLEVQLELEKLDAFVRYYKLKRFLLITLAIIVNFAVTWSLLKL